MTETSALSAPGYEVEADMVEVHDDRGFPHWLSRGASVPDWVADDRIAELLKAGALSKFEVI